MGIPIAPRASASSTGRSKRALRKGVQAAWRDLVVTTHELRHTQLPRTRTVLLLWLLLAVLVIVLLSACLSDGTWSKEKKKTAHGTHYRYKLLGSSKPRTRFRSRKGRRVDDHHTRTTDDHGRRRCPLTVKDLTDPSYPFIARVVHRRPSSWAVHTLFRGPLLTARIPLDMNVNLTRITGHNRSPPRRLRYSRRAVDGDDDDDPDLLVAAAVSVGVARDNGMASFSSSSSSSTPARHDQAVTSSLVDDGKQAVVCRWNDVSSDVRSALTQLEPHAPPNSNSLDSRHAHAGLTETMPGVSLVAACKDRSDMLGHVMPSWRALRGVSEMIVVDWGSHPAMIDAAHSPLRARFDESVMHHSPQPQLVVVRVVGNDARQWTLSRAYNLAIRLAAYDTVLKVDCDTSVHRDFLSQHPLPAATGPDSWDVSHGRVFFAANNSVSDVQADPQALHANGVLLARRAHLLEVGGYDERLETYGWDDSDIMSRLTSQSHHVASGAVTGRTTSRWSALPSSNGPRLQMRPINLAYVSHVPHGPSLRVAAQVGRTLLPATHPLTAPVEIQRNRLLLTRSGLPPWTARSPCIPWQIVTDLAPSQSHALHGGAAARMVLLEAYNPSMQVPVAALDQLSEDARSDVDAHALRLILRRFGAPLGLSALNLPRTLPVDFLRRLMDTLAYPAQHAHVSVSLHGGIMARLLALLSAIQLADLTSTGVNDDLTTRSTTTKTSKSTLAIPPPSPFTRWHLSFRWTHDDRLGTSCRMFTLFEHTPVEVCDDDSAFNFRRGKCPTFYRPMSAPSSSPLTVSALHDLAASNRVKPTLSRFSAHAHPVSIQTPWHSIVTTATSNSDRTITTTQVLQQHPTTSNSSFSPNSTIHVASVDSTCDPDRLVTSSAVCFWLQPTSASMLSDSVVHRYSNLRSSQHHRHTSVLDVDYRRANPNFITPLLPASARDTVALFDHTNTASALPAVAATWAGASADVYGTQARTLLARARTTFVAACLAERFAMINKNTATAASGRLPRVRGLSDHLREELMRIVPVLNSLFAGCEQNVCDYFVRAPELAVISASLITHEQCVRPGFAIGV